VPFAPSPVYNKLEFFFFNEVRYMHIPVRKSLGCPTSIQNPEEKVINIGQ